MKLHSAFVAASLLICSFAYSADREVEGILKSLRESYRKVQTARFEVVASIPELGGDENTINSTIEYRSPLSFRIVSKAKSMGDGQLTMISDGKKFYTKGPDGKTETKVLSLDDAGAFLNLESLCFWDWKRQLSTEKTGNMHDSQLRLLKRETYKEKDYMVLEEKAPKSKVFVRYYIDPKTTMITRTVVYDLEDTATIRGEYKILRLETGAKIPADAVKIPQK